MVRRDVVLRAPASIIALMQDGDEIGWGMELNWLWTMDRKRTLELMDDVIARGFKEPILLGPDGRVWDGHHRLAVGLALQKSVPVEWAEQ